MKKLIKQAVAIMVVTFFICGITTLFGFFGLDEYMQGVVGAGMSIAVIELINDNFKDKRNE